MNGIVQHIIRGRLHLGNFVRAGPDAILGLQHNQAVLIGLTAIREAAADLLNQKGGLADRPPRGEQTIVVTKANHRKRTLTIQKRDVESGDPIPNTSFHIRGVNIGYENDVVTGADGKATLPNMPSGCFEIEETFVPSPWILDTNNRRTVWIDAAKDQDVTADFVNSTRPGLRLLKLDGQTGRPVSKATFLIEEVGGGFSDRRQTDQMSPEARQIWNLAWATGFFVMLSTFKSLRVGLIRLVSSMVVVRFSSN